MKIRFPLCLFNRHAPQRNRVKWDGLNFVGHCRFCKRDIRKKHYGSWHKDWLADRSSNKPLFLPSPAPERDQAD